MYRIRGAAAAYLLAACLISTAAYAQRAASPQPSARPMGRTVPLTAGQSYLGIGVYEVDEERARALKLREPHGVEIKSVADNSPAARAGLREQDVVLQYNSQRVEGVEQFIRLVLETPVGRKVRLDIFRDGKPLALAAIIGYREKPLVIIEETFEIEPPRMPEVRLPDTARSFLTWQSPTLGIESESLGSQLAAYFGVREGALVRSVFKDSPAESAGLKAGDVIVKIDDRRVSGPRDISLQIRTQRSRKSFQLIIVRDRREQAVTITLDEDVGAMQ